MDSLQNYKTTQIIIKIMQEIQFISYDKEGKPKTKVFKGKEIEDLLVDPSKPGKIIQELNQEES